MGRATPLGYVAEPARQVPVAYDVDVAVVGGGLSGMFAAIAAGRQGVRTLVLDRFGSLGGNLGPAMIVGGSVAGEAPVTLPGGLQGIPKEVNDEMEALRSETGHKYADIPNIISHLAAQKALAGRRGDSGAGVGRRPHHRRAARHRDIRRGQVGAGRRESQSGH